MQLSFDYFMDSLVNQLCKLSEIVLFAACKAALQGDI
jgi:hypothetical protein